MKRFLVAVVAVGCGLLVSTSMARKTYTFEEIESMKKAGKLTGKERFVLIRGNDASGLIGDKTAIPSLVPSAEKEAEKGAEKVKEKTVSEAKPVVAPDKKQVVAPDTKPVVTADKQPVVAVEPKPVVAEETQAAVIIPDSKPAAVSETIAYDRIGKTRYLITMAREYYGNGDFWPYIYEENRARFGHPDKITPGTTVYIPSLTKYGVDPKNPSDVEKAKRKGKEIYARYGK